MPDETPERVRPKLTCGPGRTRPEFANECDVNQILRKFQATGLVAHLAKGEPKYGDFTNVTSYEEAVEQVRAAEMAFLELPSNIRRRFDNNPTKLVTFMANPENVPEARELGLIPGNKRAKPAQPVTDTVTGGEPPLSPNNVAPDGTGTTGDS